jgi:uncharacterized membrane protein YcaP (DUF421 family)
MDSLFSLNWERMFSMDTPLLEIFLRGTIMYLGLFIMLRVIRRRESTELGVTDLLVVVLLADAAQNAMAGEYTSITDGLLLVATIVGWSFVLDWLAYHFPLVQRLVHSPPLLLVKDGQIMRRNLRKEFLTEEELESQLRKQGVDDMRQVKRSYMEPDGRISVITADGQQHGAVEDQAA